MIERYYLSSVSVKLIQAPDGSWVKYKDYINELSELKIDAEIKYEELLNDHLKEINGKSVLKKTIEKLGNEVKVLNKELTNAMSCILDIQNKKYKQTNEE